MHSIACFPFLSDRSLGDQNDKSESRSRRSNGKNIRALGRMVHVLLHIANKLQEPDRTLHAFVSSSER